MSRLRWSSIKVSSSHSTTTKIHDELLQRYLNSNIDNIFQSDEKIHRHYLLTLVDNIPESRSSHCRQKVKRKSKKRKSSAVLNAGGNISEGSESSLDEALKDYMENIANQSDSDDLLRIARLQSLINFTSHSISLAESDSFTENFSPMRPGRRRRRFKRMAVDVQQPDSEMPITDYLREQRLKRLTSARPKVNKPQTGEQMSVDCGDPSVKSRLAAWSNDEVLSEGGGGDATVSSHGGSGGGETMLGKRKRGMKAANSLDLLDDELGQAKSETM